MLLEIMGLIFATSASCFSTYALFYYFNHEETVLFTKKITWESMKVYCYLLDLYEKNISAILNRKKIKNDGDENIHYINKERFITFDLEKETEQNFCPSFEKYNFILLEKEINNKKYYKRLIDNNYEIKPIKKPFLQVEIEFNNKKKEIQKDLNPFYIENNFLDKIFFIWFMKKMYSEDINDYVLHIIDFDINVFSISSSQTIIFNENKYAIKDI